MIFYLVGMVKCHLMLWYKCSFDSVLLPPPPPPHTLFFLLINPIFIYIYIYSSLKKKKIKKN